MMAWPNTGPVPPVLHLLANESITVNGEEGVGRLANILGRLPEAKLCTEEHESRNRGLKVGPVADCVYAATLSMVTGFTFLNRLTQIAPPSRRGGRREKVVVLIRGDLPGCRLCCGVAAPTARIVRWGLTGQKSAEVVVSGGGTDISREGPNVE